MKVSTRKTAPPVKAPRSPRLRNSARYAVSPFIPSGKFLPATRYMESLLWQSPLFIIASLGLLYMLGSEVGQSPESTVGSDGEGGLSSVTGFSTGKRFFGDTARALVLQYGGLIPFQLLGLGTSVYAAGQQPTSLGKAQALVTSLTSLTLGGASVILHSFLDTYESGYLPLNQTLQEKALQPLLTGGQPLAKSLNKLVHQLSVFEEKLNAKGLPDYFDLEKRKLAIEATKDKVYARLSKKTFLQQLEQGTRFRNPEQYRLLRLLGGQLEVSQNGFIRVIRTLNPVFAYFIGSTLIGVPLANGINKLMARHAGAMAESSGLRFQPQYPGSPGSENAPAQAGSENSNYPLVHTKLNNELYAYTNY